MRLLFIGGCKSGKSSAAQRIAKLLGENAPLYYWATMEPHDNEDLARIRRHIADRDGWGFTTVERARHLTAGLTAIDPTGTVLFDSVTACLAAQMFEDGGMDTDAPRRGSRPACGYQPPSGELCLRVRWHLHRRGGVRPMDSGVCRWAGPYLPDAGGRVRCGM